MRWMLVWVGLSWRRANSTPERWPWIDKKWRRSRAPWRSAAFQHHRKWFRFRSWRLLHSSNPVAMKLNNRGIVLLPGDKHDRLIIYILAAFASAETIMSKDILHRWIRRREIHGSRNVPNWVGSISGTKFRNVLGTMNNLLHKCTRSPVDSDITWGGSVLGILVLWLLEDSSHLLKLRHILDEDLKTTKLWTAMGGFLWTAERLVVYQSYQSP